MALNTRIRGAQINLADNAIVVSADSLAFYDVTDGAIYRESVADFIIAVAGNGLGASAGVLSLALSELTDTAIDVSADSIPFLDATDSGSKRESVADFVSAISGNGLTDASGVLAVLNDGGTLTVTGSGVKVSDNGIDDLQLNAGAGTSGQILRKGTGNTIYWDTETSVSETYITEAEIITENVSAQIGVTGYTGAFTITYAPVLSSVQVFLNGLLQEEGTGKDYEIGGTGNQTITFVTDPIVGDIVIIHYVRT
jgi:hypothetical protein